MADDELDDGVVRFDEYQSSVDVAPGWMQKPRAMAWNQAMGTGKNTLSDAATMAIAVRRPRDAPFDSLAQLGFDRQIARAPRESDAQYAAVLERWIWWHENAGNPLVIKAIFERVGFTSYTLLGNDEHDAGDGHFGEVEDYCARLWIVLNTPHCFTPSKKWGDSITWGGGKKWGFESSVDGMWPFLVSELKQWKAAHVQIVAVKIVFADASFVWARVDR